MDNNNLQENAMTSPQLNIFLPVAPISSCFNPTLLPGGTMERDYNLYDYRKGLTHREILKERIRQEMYAEKALEEELRREILMEDCLLIPKMMFPKKFIERGFNEGILTNSSAMVNHEVTETVPFQRGPNAMVPKVESSLPQSIKERLFMLPMKPNGSSNVRIGFANPENTPPTHVKKVATSGYVKAEKRNLFCYICGVHSTSSQALHDHVQGKKHQTKAKLKVKLKSNWKKGNNQKNKRARK